MTLSGDIGGVEYGLNLYTYILAVYYQLFGCTYLDSKLINCFIGGCNNDTSISLSPEIFSR